VQFLFELQRAIQELESPLGVSQVLVAIADEAERDRLAMAILFGLVRVECFLILGQSGYRPGGRVQIPGSGEYLVAGIGLGTAEADGDS
jgi:hypothetical protein